MRAMAVADVAISEWFHAHGHPALTQVMLVITHVHGTLGICLLALGIGFLLLRRHQSGGCWRWYFACPAVSS